MLAQIKRKNRAQRMLERRFAIERVAAQCAERLAHCPAQAVDDEIQKALQAVFEAQKADRGILGTGAGARGLDGGIFLALRGNTGEADKSRQTGTAHWTTSTEG